MLTWKDEIKEKSFVDGEMTEQLLGSTKNPSREDFDRVMEKAAKQQELSLEDVAILLNSESKDRISEIFNLASSIKKRVYGNRVVLFAPLYLGNKCTNSNRSVR